MVRRTDGHGKPWAAGSTHWLMLYWNCPSFPCRSDTVMLCSSCSTKRSPSCFTAQKNEAGLGRALPAASPLTAPTPPRPPHGGAVKAEPYTSTQEGAQRPSFPNSEILASPLPRSSPLEVIRILQPGGLCEAVTNEGRRRRRRQLPAAISHLGRQRAGSARTGLGTRKGVNTERPEDTFPGREAAAFQPAQGRGQLQGTPHGSTVLPEIPQCCPGLLCPKSLDQQPMRDMAPTQGTVHKAQHWPCGARGSHIWEHPLQHSPRPEHTPLPKPQGQAPVPCVLLLQRGAPALRRGANPRPWGRPATLTAPPGMCRLPPGWFETGAGACPSRSNRQSSVRGCGMGRGSPTPSFSSLKGEDGGHPPRDYGMGQGSPTAFSFTSMKGEDGGSPSPGSGGTVVPRGWRAPPQQCRLSSGTYSEACPRLPAWGS